MVEKQTSSITSEIAFYRKHTRNEGPHSILGKFYREMVKKRESTIYDLVVAYLDTHIHVEYEDSIQLFLEDNPQYTQFDVIIDAYTVGENSSESSALEDILQVGFYSLLGQYMFE